jgi:hypothetical protein
VTDTGPPTPPPSLPSGWGSSPVGPPPSTPVTHPTTSTIAHAPAPRKRWLIVLIGVLVLIFGCGVAGTVLFFNNTWPPLEAANDFANDVERGDIEGALGRGCDGFRTDTGRNFIRFLRLDLDSIEVNPFGVDRDGDRATVKLTIRRNVSDDARTFRMLFVHEDGEWRPCFPR